MTYGKKVKSRVLLKPKKKEKIIVFGTSLSGLSCAFELKNKGYIVDLYEKENILGQEVYEIYKEILSEEFINEDLKKLKD